MEEQIKWETDLRPALQRARSEERPILLIFFHLGCIGCQQMDAVTFPTTYVIRFIEKRMVPVRLAWNEGPLATDFNVKWTPTLIILDRHGKEHHRTVGFLSAEELIPSLLLGLAKVDFDEERYEEALLHLAELLSAYPQSNASPEAIYFQGVCRYKKKPDPTLLKKTYERLKARYPSSPWTKRAYPYSLL